MKANKLLYSIVAVLLSAGLLILWLAAAMNYGDDVAAGTYRYKRGSETSTLILRLDHTYTQSRRLGKDEQHTAGTWRHEGEGGVSFSKQFLVLAGDEPEPDGTTFAEIHKTLGLFPALSLRQYHVLWYGKTDASSSVSGTYKGDEPGVPATLALSADHSFSQDVLVDGIAHHADGTWDQGSDGTVRFSRAFLKTSGEPLAENETASSAGTRGSMLQIEISTSAHLPEPVLRKSFSPW